MGVKGFDRHYLLNHGFTQHDLLGDALRMAQ
jgi:hypothetical protein